MIFTEGQNRFFGLHRHHYFLRQAVTFAIFGILLFLAQNLMAQGKQDANGADETISSITPFSLSLNGTDAYLTVPNSATLNLGSLMTLETWIKSADYTLPQTIIERYSQFSRQGGYGLRVSNNAVIFTICPAQKRCTNVTGTAALVPNQWQHIAAVLDGGEVRIYINGQLNSRNNTRVQPPGAVSDAMYIGGRNDGRQMFQGLLDEVSVSNTALYTANFTPAAQLESTANTVGLWRFDGGTFNDSTNINNATVTGGATFSLDVPRVAVNGFVITPTPNVGPSNELTGVKTISPTDVWAVGSHGPAGFCCYPRTPVSLHWDGSQWNNVPVPTTPGAPTARLIAVDATSSTNVWAVGSDNRYFSEKVSLLRWNGTQWNIVALVSDPVSPTFGIGRVDSITVISENDVWIVGQRLGGSSWTLHWDGTSLQTVPSPNLDNFNQLYDVDAISANDIWAVGYAIVIRWNGTEWLPVLSAPRSAQYQSVAAISPNDVWTIAGYTICPPIGGCVSSVGFLHFNGRQWIPVQPPATNGQLFLYDISATSSDNVWAVGSDGNNKTYVAHYDGVSWQRVASQNTSPTDIDLDRLFSVSALDSNNVFTVGAASDLFYSPQGNQNTTNNLAEKYGLLP